MSENKITSLDRFRIFEYMRKYSQYNEKCKHWRQKHTSTLSFNDGIYCIQLIQAKWSI